MFQQLRDSEVWKLTGDLSVLHWIFTITIPSISSAIGILQGLALPWIILIFLTAVVLVLAARYYWFKHALLANRKQFKARLKQKQSLSKAIVLPIALVMLIGLKLLPVSQWIGSSIRILGVVTHDDFVQGKVEPNGKRPMFNVLYFNRGTSAVESSAFYRMDALPRIPSDWDANKERYENRYWEETKTDRKYLTPKPETLNPADELTPNILTIFQPDNGPPDLLEKITKDQAILYVMVFFTYRDIWGEHESDFCGYLWGDPHIFHPCAKHNTP